MKANKDPLGPMPESDAAIEGGTGGSTGGASTADLRRGYSNANEKPEDPYERFLNPATEPGGFLGRPHGYER